MRRIENVTIIQPKRPTGPGWVAGPPVDPRHSLGYDAFAWQHPELSLRVISAVEVAEVEPGEEAIGPCYHVSISKGARDGRPIRCTSEEARWVLTQFGLEDGKEDNHVPHGKVRNFWRPVADRLSGYECPCVDKEPAIREDNGDYVWRPS